MNKTAKIDDSTDLKKLIIERTEHIRDIIRSTTASVQYYRGLSIFSNVDLNACLTALNDLYSSTNNIIDDIESNAIETVINMLQKIIDRLSIILSGYGTKRMDDLIYITLGSEFNKSIPRPDLASKYEIIRQHVHPIGFKLITDSSAINISDNICMDKITDDSIKLELAPMLECFTYDLPTSSIFCKINGIRVVIRGPGNKLIIINGIVDDINLELFSNEYINKRKSQLISNRPDVIDDVFSRHIDQLTIRDVLIFSNQDIIKKYYCVLTTVNSIKTDNIDQIIKKFTKLDTIGRRSMLIDLLTYSIDSEIQYIAYLLYDIVTNDTSESNDHISMFDTFGWKTRLLFKDTMKQTVKHVQMLTTKYDVSRITLEQQIHLLRVPDNVKEKAMNKLKEVKNKSDESGLKAKQYLEGLLKIPFNVFREEPILHITKRLNLMFSKNLVEIRKLLPDIVIEDKPSYTNSEIYHTICKIKERVSDSSAILNRASSKQIELLIKNINANIENKNERLYLSKLKNKQDRIKAILGYLSKCDLVRQCSILSIIDDGIARVEKDTKLMLNEINTFKKSIGDIENILDASVYGHANAKQQITKIISQWINGELSGYCFGFEGSPGVGKTSLAKLGLSNCLKDENGNSRPFSFIAMGGACNGAYLVGHGYTYMNAQWGKIAQITMDSGCLNPIIYIDEFDKESKSEQGKEITGILTHLLDQSQNDEFEDKFFSGIPLDLSKALIIVSYNDPNNIDKVLLDRIHRIKFDNLEIEDKLIIAKDYILPDINKKMGFHNTVKISDEILYEIINSYTCEPGVRKLKEVLFDIYGSINVELLKCDACIQTFPIILTMDDIEFKYLKKYDKINETKINDLDFVGTINGMWANQLGRGGILGIETAYYPSNTFLDLKLTGLQGEVMKESMNVAKSLAWSLCTDDIRNKLSNDNKNSGIHIHCTSGGVGKEGPSAGTAVTAAIFSLFNDKPIRRDVAITGEIDLLGNVTAIGGLEYKISGSIRAGIKKILYPAENANDFRKLNEKRKLPDNIEFVEVSNINDVLKEIFI
jgi:ATP-dependent Lon protease